MLSIPVLVDPSEIVGFYVVPLGFEFIAEGPQELTLYSVVKDVSSAISKSLNISVREEGRVSSAFTVSNHRDVTLTPGTQNGSRAVKIDVVWLW